MPGQEGEADRIRAGIAELERVKDEVAGLIRKSERGDEAVREMWIGDVKDAYYSVVAAFDLVVRPSETQKREEEHAASSRDFLERAKSRVKQVSSELKTFGERKADELGRELERDFEEVSGLIAAEADSISPKLPPAGPVETIVKVSEDEYELRCSLCGDLAVVFKVEVPEFPVGRLQKALLYRGITKSTYLDISKAATVFGFLGEGDISRAHALLEERMEGGLDAYCPECDKVYCREDYGVDEQWDEGFYDCTYGTCPKGHRRLIDE